MAKSSWTIDVLVVLLVGTNCWWAYNAVDAGVTCSYAQVTLENNKEALAQSLAVIEAAAKSWATRQSIIQATRTGLAEYRPRCRGRW